MKRRVREQILYVDRYTATGTPRPKRSDVCRGPCEGIGFFPCREPRPGEKFRRAWLAAERRSPTRDGYHFLRCPDCRGTGRRS